MDGWIPYHPVSSSTETGKGDETKSTPHTRTHKIPTCKRKPSKTVSPNLKPKKAAAYPPSPSAIMTVNIDLALAPEEDEEEEGAGVRKARSN